MGLALTQAHSASQERGGRKISFALGESFGLDNVFLHHKGPNFAEGAAATMLFIATLEVVNLGLVKMEQA